MKSTIMILFVLSSISLSQEILPPEKCGECHIDIYEDWIGSRHANSTPETNPLFASLYRKSIKDTDGGTKYFCIRCHAPLSSINGDKDLKLAETRQGVTCQACHTAIDLSMHPDSWPLEYGTPGTVFSSGESRSEDAHIIVNSNLFNSGDICSTCHGEMIDIPGLTSCGGLPICNQSGESLNGNIEKRCIDCHMSKPQTHAFSGAYSRTSLSKALDVDASWKIFSDELVIDLVITNNGTGHRFPSGPPSRAGILKLTAENANGQVIWSNFSTDPVIEDPNSVFHVVLGTNQDLKPAMPWNAKRVLKDTRFKPGEDRAFTYKFPSQDVATVNIQIFYRLAPIMMLDNFKIEDPFLRKSHLVTSAVLMIN